MNNILAWIVLGAILGIIINITDEKPSIETFFETAVLGILGALLGGFLSNLLLGIGIGVLNPTTLILSALGAIGALLIRRTFGSI